MNDRILDQIDRLLMSYGSSRNAVNREWIEELCKAANAFPESLVARVVDKFIAGTVHGQSLDFPPKPPLFATALRSEPRHPGEPGFESREDYLRKHLPSPKNEPSPEQKERVRRLIDSFRRAHAEQKQGEQAPYQAPLSEDQAGYLKAIMALKDRDGITDEERRHQQNVARKIDGAAA